MKIEPDVGDVYKVRVGLTEEEFGYEWMLNRVNTPTHTCKQTTTHTHTHTHTHINYTLICFNYQMANVIN